MKKHILCHYKNKSLLFCTIEAFPSVKAHKVLEIFNNQGLTSILERKSGNSFQVVGRIYMNYDPFENGSTTWEDVLSTMTNTMVTLEEKMLPIYDQRIAQLTG